MKKGKTIYLFHQIDDNTIDPNRVLQNVHPTTT